MNIDADVDVFISLFDVIILLFLIWGGYKGYVRGAIIEAITLFALIGGMVVSVLLTKLIYNFFITRSEVPDLFSVLLLGSFFVGAIWFSNIVSRKVKQNVGDIRKGTQSRFIGMGLGIVKFFFIVAIYIVVIYKLNLHANFLPASERNSKLGNASKFIMTKVFPHLKMETNNIYTDKDTTVFENTNTDF
jgi:uncharacterized membrane protein required for colicin V production